MNTTTKTCHHHGAYESSILDICGTRIESGCPVCVDQELARINGAKAATLSRATLDQEAAAMKSMNLEPAYWSASLDNFEAVTQEQQKALDVARKVLAGDILKVLMTGKNGTGKTHLACALVRAFRGRILTMFEISTTIRASYTALATRTELEILDELARLPLLAIDEIGRTKGSDTEANWLSYLIDKRHARALPLVLVSNNHVRKDCPSGGCDRCLENYLGEDVMSRMSEDSVLVRFQGEDYRRKRRGHAAA